MRRNIMKQIEAIIRNTTEEKQKTQVMETNNHGE